MLWDIIRDFFVQYIWGGYLSNGDTFYASFIGNLFDANGGSVVSVNTESFRFKIGAFFDNNLDYLATDVYMSIGDWLSTTSTIIVLIGICIFLYLVAKYLFKFVAGLFKW